ncbi:3359_t:CDS:2, partial [Gigaspora rosea]
KTQLSYWPFVSQYMKKIPTNSRKRSNLFWIRIEFALQSNDENIAKSGFLSGLNNIIVYPLHQESQFPLYVDKFGFTPDKVELLQLICGDLKTNDVRNDSLNTYWVDTGSTQMLKNLYEKQAFHLRKLLR